MLDKEIMLCILKEYVSNIKEQFYRALALLSTTML